MPSKPDPSEFSLPYYQIAHSSLPDAAHIDMKYFLHGVQSGLVEFVSIRIPHIYREFYDLFGSASEVDRARYALIAICSLLYSHCIQYGLESNIAFYLLKHYTEKAITLDKPAEIEELCATMAQDFTLRMNSKQLTSGKSALVSAAINYILYNLHDRLTIESICKQVGTSSSQLCHKFKQECGITLRQFILQHKIEAVKEMLLYSNRTHTEISAILNFCSPSHLSTSFKKVTGMTPLQYVAKYNASELP